MQVAAVSLVRRNHPSLPWFVIKHGWSLRPPITSELSVRAKLSYFKTPAAAAAAAAPRPSTDLGVGAEIIRTCNSCV